MMNNRENMQSIAAERVIHRKLPEASNRCYGEGDEHRGSV